MIGLGNILSRFESVGISVGIYFPNVGTRIPILKLASLIFKANLLK